MRKEKLVTRTFKYYDSEILGYNTETSNTETKHFVTTRKFKEVKNLIDVFRKQEEMSGSTFVPVKVLSTVEKTELRGMTESKFINDSDVIPERTTKSAKNN